MEQLYGQATLVSFGHVLDNWSYEGNDGLVLASDESCLKNGSIHRLGIVLSVDDNDNPSAIRGLFLDGKKISTDLGGLRNELKAISGLQSWEVNTIIELVKNSVKGESIAFADSGVAQCSEGDGGEVRLEFDDENRTQGAFALSATYYPSDEYTTDGSLPYGINCEGKEPEEYRDFGCVVFSPNAESIKVEAEEALDYFKKYNSATLAIDTIRKWRFIDVEPLADIWSITLESLKRDTYPATHVWAARVARDILGDDTLYQKILLDLLDFSITWEKGYPYAVIEVTNELYNEGCMSRKDACTLIEKAAERVDLQDPSELSSLIEHVTNEYGGLKMGDKDFAAKLVVRVLEKISDKKIAAKFKKLIA